MNLKNIMKISSTVNFFSFFFLFFVSVLAADVGDSVINTINSKTNNFFWGISGLIQYGESNGTAIAPENGRPDNIGASYEMGYGISGYALYGLSDEWKIFFEIGYSDRRILCARKDEYGVGKWVSDVSGDTTNNFYGPFDNDVYFYMDTFIIRPGIKYYVQTDRNVTPWFGLGLSIYPWNASYMSGDRSKTWSSTNGVCLNFNFLYFGFDMKIDFGEKETVILSLFTDIGAPAVKLKFNNLFQDGWTYENNEGEEVVSTYKFGIIMLFEL